MTRFVMSLALAAVVGLGAVSAAQACGGDGGYEKPYFLTHGKRFDYGWCYPGAEHKHWAWKKWSDKYGCNLFFDPYLEEYFYYVPAQNCYYPMSYSRVVPPVAEKAAPPAGGPATPDPKLPPPVEDKPGIRDSKPIPPGDDKQPGPISLPPAGGSPPPVDTGAPAGVPTSAPVPPDGAGSPGGAPK